MGENDFEFYQKDGRNYTRVSSVLDLIVPPELVEWKMETGKREANRISKQALKFGSRIDEIIRLRQEPNVDDRIEVLSCFRAFQKWKKINFVKDEDIVFPETVFDDELGVAGTPDIYWIPHKTIIDIKSSRSIKDNYYFQTGFYSTTKQFPVEQVAILRLDKAINDFQYLTNEDLGISLEKLRYGFRSLAIYYKLYKQVQNALKPNVPVGQEYL